MISNNNADQEIVVWGEINAMRLASFSIFFPGRSHFLVSRHAMLEYGTVSPIGTRQEKLLGNLMTEIVRSTLQDKPLEICGLPVSGSNTRLYPHSHKTAFEATSTTDAGAPLPTSPPVGAQFGPQMPDASMLGNMNSVHSHMQGVATPQQQIQHDSQNMWYTSPQHAHAHAAQSQSPQAHISPPNPYMM